MSERLTDEQKALELARELSDAHAAAGCVGGCSVCIVARALIARCEPVDPKKPESEWQYVCGACSAPLREWYQHCAECGKRLKWKD